jgi:uncharacterized protein involved in outer membrane biogenesis
LHPGPLRYWYSPRHLRFWLILCLALYTLAGFFLVPTVTKYQLEKQLGTLMQRQVKVAAVRFNPYTLAAEVDGFAIADTQGGNLAGFDRLRVNFQASSLFRQAWTFREITLVHPYGDLQLLKDGSTNFHGLVPAQGEQAEEKQKANIPRVIVETLALTEGDLTLADHTRPDLFTTEIRNIRFQLDNLSTLPSESGQLVFGAKSEEGVALLWQGKVQLNPVLVEGDLKATGGYLPLGYRYFGDFLNVELVKGDLDLALHHRLAMTDQGITASVSGLELVLSDLLVSDKPTGEPILALPSLALRGLNLTWPDKMVDVSDLALTSPVLKLIRLSDNSVNLQHLLAGEHPQPSAAAQVTDATPPAQQDSTSAWSLTLKSATVSDMSLTVEDRTLGVPATTDIADIDLALSNISNRADQVMPFTASIRPAAGGSVALKGQLVALPALTVESNVSINGLPLNLSQPYVDDVATIDINSGTLSADAAIKITPTSPFSIEGSLAITDVAARKKGSANPLISWRNIGVEELAYSLPENHLAIGRILVEEPAARIRIREDRTTNFQALVVAKQPPESTPPPDKPDGQSGNPFTLVIGHVQVQEGAMDFSDRSLPIPFQTNIAKLQGELNSIDTSSSQAANLDFEGQVADYGLARISGELLPNNVKKQADVKLLLRNVVMPDLSPYTIKFAGHKIASGRMNLDLRYRLNDGTVDGKNNIVLTDVRLGEKVPHKDALDLPLSLALALLKDVNGKIDIDLPVKGDTANPEFSIGGIIGKAIANLLTKAVTAPFRLLGSLVGASSNDFGKPEFEPGKARLTPPEKEKIAKLAEALKQRPNLLLKVAGAYNLAADTEALKTREVDQAIKAALADDDEGPTLESRQNVVENLYRARHPEADLNAMRHAFITATDAESVAREQFDRSAYNADVRARLIAETEISQDQLTTLAESRANAIAEELTVTNGFNPERLKVLQVKTANTNKSGWIPLKLELASSKK